MYYLKLKKIKFIKNFQFHPHYYEVSAFQNSVVQWLLNVIFWKYQLNIWDSIYKFLSESFLSKKYQFIFCFILKLTNSKNLQAFRGNKDEIWIYIYVYITEKKIANERTSRN